jgi:hypothetical protein
MARQNDGDYSASSDAKAYSSTETGVEAFIVGRCSNEPNLCNFVKNRKEQETVHARFEKRMLFVKPAFLLLDKGVIMCYDGSIEVDW